MNIAHVTHDTSTIEGLTAKARALHAQMQAAEASRAQCIDTPDVITHMQMRALRRDAHTTLYALESAAKMPHRDAFPNIAVPVQDADTKTTLATKNAKDVLLELISAYKNSIFVKDGGAIIRKSKPKNLPLMISIAEQSKDAWVKLVGFGRAHPYQFGAIVTTIVALKILFAMVVFDALDDLARKLLGLRKRKSKKDDQPQTNVTPKKSSQTMTFPPANAPALTPALAAQFNAPPVTPNMNAALPTS